MLSPYLHAYVQPRLHAGCLVHGCPNSLSIMEHPLDLVPQVGRLVPTGTRGDGVVWLAQRVVGVACSQPQVCSPALAAHLDAASPSRAAQAALGAVEGEARTGATSACP